LSKKLPVLSNQIKIKKKIGKKKYFLFISSLKMSQNGYRYIFSTIAKKMKKIKTNKSIQVWSMSHQD